MAAIDEKDLDTLTLEEFCQVAQDSTQDPTQEQRVKEYLGDANFQQLTEAFKGPSRGLARGSKGTVILLHGIMGSQIGKSRRRDWDIIWLNPLAIRDGSMSRLKIGPGSGGYGARGLIPMFYSVLWARLKFWYGYDVREYAYDWRVSVRQSADDFVQFFKDEELSGPVSLLAHSMGGLVARAALPKFGDRVQRVIQLATPNYGSFSPVLTLCGQNEFVNKILALDITSTPAKLLSGTVSSFQGLCELMPAPSRFSTVNLFDAKNWPDPGSLDFTTLSAAGNGIADLEKLYPPDQRFVLIAGQNQDTITDMTRNATTGEFQFLTTKSGDGTVPLNFARFDSNARIPTYLADVTHNGILFDTDVAAAVDDILQKGKTDKLTTDTGSGSRRGEKASRLDTANSQNPFGGRRGDSISRKEIIEAQREVLGPVETGGGRIPPGLDTCDRMRQDGFNNVVVSRRRRRLRFALAFGDATQVPAHAHMLGVFEGVTPTGAAVAYDRVLGGALSDLFARRMFAGARGTVYLVPTYKTQLPGELLVLAGLGAFRDFESRVVEDVASQVLTSLVRVHASELVTVLIGGSSSNAFSSTSSDLCSFLRGFITGLKESDRDHEFRRLILCESDENKYKKLKIELYQMAASSLFDDVEVEFEEINVTEKYGRSTRGDVGVRLPKVDEAPVYFFSNLVLESGHGNDDTTYSHEVTILPPSLGTTVPRYIKSVSKNDLDDLLMEIADGAPEDVEDFGARLTKLIMTEDMGAECKGLVTDSKVQLVHDALSSRIPWECVKFSGVSPAVEKGFSRRYQRTRSAAFFSESQRHNKEIRVLLAYNPLGDLKGADVEGKMILDIAARSSGKLRVESLRGKDASRDAIINQLKTGEFDVFHYAGHAKFVSENPAQSGLLCAGAEVLCGGDLEPLGARLPPLIVLNACESGRVRRRKDEFHSGSASAAEAILNAGIMCFIATYWPVGDASAGMFSDVFYDHILQGLESGQGSNTIGEAMLAARKSLKSDKQADWADYMLYGNPDFTIKLS
jgi:pimeloyl-ACP methyl ester carboxylesterase